MDINSCHNEKKYNSQHRILYTCKGKGKIIYIYLGFPTIFRKEIQFKMAGYKEFLSQLEWMI